MVYNPESLELGPRIYGPESPILHPEIHTVTELQPLHEIDGEDATYIPLGRLGDLGIEAQGSIGENNNPLNEIDVHKIEDAVTPVSNVVCCIDGRTRMIAEKIKSSGRRTFNFLKQAAGNPIKVAGGAAGIAYSGFLAGMAEGVNKENYATQTRDEAKKNIFRPLRLKKSVHADEHSHGNNCGCGACDKLTDINASIRNNINRYHDLYDAFANEAPEIFPESEEADRSSVRYHTKLAIDKSLIPCGKEITKSYKVFHQNPVEEESHDEAQVVVTGIHDEQAIIINLEDDNTVDKNQLDFKLFWVDLGPISHKIQSGFVHEDGMHSKRNARRLIYATTLFQLATSAQLCHPDMPVYIRKKKPVTTDSHDSPQPIGV